MTRPTSQSRQGLTARLRGATLDLTPLRESRPYRRLLFGDAVSVLGTQITIVAVPIQVYDQTRSAAAVGLVGLAGLVPLIVFGLYGGAIADAVDRRRLVLLTTVGQAALALVLVAQAVAGLGSTLLLYAVVAVQAGLFAIDSPARQAFVPRLLPVALLPAANALKQVEFNLGVTVGPLLAGLLIGRYGYEAAYGLDALTFLAAIVAVAGLPAMPPAGGGRRAGTASVLEGLAFLRTRQVLLMTFVVDLVAMVFAMPRALFPALAEQVYGGDPRPQGCFTPRSPPERCWARCSPGGSAGCPARGSSCSRRSRPGGWRSRSSVSVTCCGSGCCASRRRGPRTWSRPSSGSRSCRRRRRTRCAAGSGACSSWSSPADPASATRVPAVLPRSWGCRGRPWPVG